MHNSTKDYNAETIFPWGMLDIIVAILKEKNAEITTYANCKLEESILPDPYKYLSEYAGYKINSRNPFSTALVTCALVLRDRQFGIVSKSAKRFLNKELTRFPQVFFQHDADRQPYKTVEMMRREKDLGIVSSNFFFYKRNVWDDDTEDYTLDIDELKAFESNGFEIGYHLNAYELAHYDLKKAFGIINRDIAFFQKHFNLKGFVPHGGVSGLNGINNDFIPNRGILKSLNWYYNGRSIRGFVKDKTWSDGNIFKAIVNPMEVASKLNFGERILFLMHPQYYGDKLMKNWEQLPVAKEKWWRALWGL
jgi:hypothetical protein